MITKEIFSYPVTIFIAGSYRKAKKIAQKYCDEIGLCVTVERTEYIYTNGREKGVRVGFINYPRFPSTPKVIQEKAIALAERLRKGLKQESYSIQTTNLTTWYSYRKENEN